MSSGESLWYCHECQTEMTPLHVPDPVCSSCHGSFVEKIENPQDDPREFAHGGPGGLNSDGLHPAIDNLFLTIQTLMDRGMTPPPRNRPDGSPASPRLSFQFTSGNGTRTMSFGGPTTGFERSRAGGDSVPTMSEFLGAGPDPGGDGQRITGPMMAQYLLALLGNRDPLSIMLAGGLAGGIQENGRMGDYVFNQEALDQIITQIMENSNAHRPVPATEEIMNKLPREVLTIGSTTLEQDCAVCKEQFKIETDDPEEQIVITLPCKHPFHQPCIIPWLKSSGTCPVCRYALIAQPSQHPTPPNAGSPSSLRPTPSLRQPSSPPSSRSQESANGGGFIQSLLGHLTGNHHSNQLNGSAGSSSHRSSPPQSLSPRSSPQHHRSNSDPASRSSTSRRRTNDRHNDQLPGGWADDLD